MPSVTFFYKKKVRPFLVILYYNLYFQVKRRNICKKQFPALSECIRKPNYVKKELMRLYRLPKVGEKPGQSTGKQDCIRAALSNYGVDEVARVLPCRQIWG